MPWSVRLQDEDGKPVIPEDALIEFETIPNDRTFKLLHYVDRYTDTVFNHAQITDFLADWGKLTPSEDQRVQWQLVRKMAATCLDEVHCYLRFIGD